MVKKKTLVFPQIGYYLLIHRKNPTLQYVDYVIKNDTESYEHRIEREEVSAQGYLYSKDSLSPTMLACIRTDYDIYTISETKYQCLKRLWLLGHAK